MSLSLFGKRFPDKNKERESSGRKRFSFLGIRITLRKHHLSKSKIKELNSNFEKGVGELVPNVVNAELTLNELKITNKSMARFGDGEFNLIWGEDLPFQRYDSELANRLKEILNSSDDNILIGIPDTFSSLEKYCPKSVDFFRKYQAYNRERIYSIIDLNKQFYDSLITRPYIIVQDRDYAKHVFDSFKQLWDGKDIVIVEGEGSRLGIGNDLFDNTKSIRRILCPAVNAFGRYSEILEECTKLPKNLLFIIALGPTATVLAYDLAKVGYRALDLGHIDVEYTWFLMKAKNKVAIEGKYVNEAKKGKVIAEVNDEKYNKQIIAKLL